MTDTQVEQQDLHISTPAQPDINWKQSRMQPPSLQPTAEQMSRKHQLVDLRNTSDVTMTRFGRPIPQVHIVLDRYNRGHEIQPGETKRGIDLTIDAIAHFMRLRAERVDDFGRPLPKHPIVVLDLDSNEIERLAREDQKRILAARRRKHAAEEESDDDEPARPALGRRR